MSTASTRMTCAIWLLALAFSACASRSGSVQPRDHAVAPAPPTTAATRSRVPSVALAYDSILSRSLSDEAIATICGHAQTYTATPIWYIRIHSAPWIVMGGGWAVTVYFIPETGTPRLRTGKYVTFSSWWLGILSRQPSPELRADLGEPTLIEYVQIAPANAPWGSDLDLPGKLTMPIPRPRQLTNDEIVELIDFAQTYRPRHAPTDYQHDRIELFDPCLDPADPIIRIEPGSNGDLAVYATGSSDASGDMLRCRKREGRWEVVSRGFWDE